MGENLPKKQVGKRIQESLKLTRYSLKNARNNRKSPNYNIGYSFVRSFLNSSCWTPVD